MKELIDGSKIPARIYYYLLDFKDRDLDFFMQSTFKKQTLASLNKEEFSTYAEYAFKKDLELLKENNHA